MFFKCITVVARLCVVAVVKLCFIIAVLFFLLLKAVVIALQVLNTPRHNQTDDQVQEPPIPNPDTTRETEHQSVQNEARSKQCSAERPRLHSIDSDTKNEPEARMALESQSAGRPRHSSTASNTKNEPDSYLALESKQLHFVERPRLISKDSNTQIESKGYPASELKRPYSTERPRLSSTGSDTKNDPDGYLASESSESPDGEQRKTQPKRKNNRKEKHLARPQSPIPSTDSDGNDSREGQLKITLTTAGEPAPSMHVPINQVGLKDNIELCSGNENRSSCDGDYIEPCQEQNEQVQSVCSHSTAHLHLDTQSVIMDLQNKVKELEDMLKLQRSMDEERMAEKDHTIEQLQIANEDMRKKLHAAKKGKITHLIEKLTKPKSYKRKTFSQRKMSKNDKRKFRHKDYICFY